MTASAECSPLTTAQSTTSQPQRPLQPPSPLTTGYQPFGIPRTESECDGMLAAAEWRIREQPALRRDIAADVARFLGASSHLWTTSRRARLERVLISAGPGTLGCVFAIVAASPRDEVVDHAVRVLVAAAAEDEGVTRTLVSLLSGSRGQSILTQAPSVREVMLRALSNSTGTVAGEAKVRVAFVLAKGDPSPAVRDAAVQALSVMGGRDAVAILTGLLGTLRETEENETVLDSIVEGLETLSGR